MSNIEINNVVDYISKIQTISNQCISNHTNKSYDNNWLHIKKMYDFDDKNDIMKYKKFISSLNANDLKEYNQNIEKYNIQNTKEYTKKMHSLYYETDKQYYINNDSYEHNLNFPQPVDNPYTFFYRGHYNSNYLLVPSVFRDINWLKEDYYYHEIMVRCPEKFQYYSHLDKLVTMQHYGCPTRLLDVTSNPLVALYFACKNFTSNSNSTQGTVYIFPVLKNDVAYADSDKALMLSCIPKFNNIDKLELYEECNNSITQDNFPKIKGGSRYQNNIVERFYHEVTTESPSFKREIKPINLLRPLVVQPNKLNGRILKQDGAFILSGLSSSEGEAYDKLSTISCLKLEISNQKRILTELEQLGIHEASLFPEVDKVANYLKEH